MNKRIRKPNAVFNQLYPIRMNRNLSKTKLRIFNTTVKSVLLYACNTRKVAQQISNKLQISINPCLWLIINIRWPENISNDNLWKVTNQQPVTLQIKICRWKWIGHTLHYKILGTPIFCNMYPAVFIENTALDWNHPGTR